MEMEGCLLTTLCTRIRLYMKSKFRIFFVSILLNVSHTSDCIGQIINSMDETLKICELPYQISGTDSALFYVVEFDAADSIYGELGKSSDAYIKIMDSDYISNRFIYSIYTFRGEDGKFCGLFPFAVTEYFNDSVDIEIKFNCSRDSYDFRNAVPRAKFSTILPEIESDFRNKEAVILADRDWMIQNHKLLLMNSSNLFEPVFDLRINQKVKDIFSDNVVFLCITMKNVFTIDAPSFQWQMISSHPKNEGEKVFYSQHSVGQMTVVFNGQKINSFFYQNDFNGVMNYYFLIDAFEGFSGLSEVYIGSELIADNFFIDGDYFDDKTKTSIQKLGLDGKDSLETVFFGTKQWAQKRFKK